MRGEGDGAKQGERLEQIVIPPLVEQMWGGGIFRSKRSGCKCWRRRWRRGKVGKRENWESRGRRGEGGRERGNLRNFQMKGEGFSFNAIKVFHLTASPADSSTPGATSLKSVRQSLCVLVCVSMCLIL